MHRCAMMLRHAGHARYVFAFIGLFVLAAGAPSQEAEPGEEPLYAAPTTLDRVGRIVAPVMINGRGPFRFIIDTAASRSVISPRLAETLGLTAAGQEQLTIQGVTGEGTVPSVLISRLQAGDIRLDNVRLPVVAPPVLADADGILGVEGFDSMRILVDFTADRISITRAGRPWRAEDGWYRIPVELRFGRLMVAPARIGDVQVKAVVDTGAERTLGNLALRDALGLGTSERLQGTGSTVIGATLAEASANTLASPLIHFGQTRIAGVDVTFADLHVFRLWGLADEPALVLGMDVLGTPRGLMFDYRRAELQIRTAKSPQDRSPIMRRATGQLGPGPP